MLLLNIEWFRESPTRDKADAILDDFILPDAVCTPPTNRSNNIINNRFPAKIDIDFLPCLMLPQPMRATLTPDVARDIELTLSEKQVDSARLMSVDVFIYHTIFSFAWSTCFLSPASSSKSYSGRPTYALL